MIEPPRLLAGLRAEVPLITQSESSECALACLAMIAGYHGSNVDLASLRQRFGISMKGATLAQMTHVAEAMALKLRPVKARLDEIDDIACPAILHWDLTHFVVLAGIERRLAGSHRYVIHDPGRGISKISLDDLSNHFTGVAVEVERAPAFRKSDERTNLNLRQLWSSISGFWPTIFKLLGLSLVLQLITLMSPFYLQLSIDNVVPASDQAMLSALAIGFGGLAIINYLATWLRSSLSLSFGTSLSYQLVNNLFGHWLKLPPGWFEKRHVGDIISRFNSTQPVTQLLSQGMITSAMDGLLAVTTLVMMTIYSPFLAGIATAALVAYFVVRLAFFETVRLNNIASISANAKESSVFIETARGAQTVKAFGEENRRQLIWQKAKIDAVNAQLKLGRLNVSFDAISQFVVALEQVAFVYVAVRMAIGGELTLGMLFAYQAYKQQFIGAGTRLIEQSVNWKILRVHLGRLADIALTPKENPRIGGLRVPEGPPQLELANVSFRYGVGERPVLNGLNLVIEPEEFVVLIGPSGGGKTTAGKILSGMLEPSGGDILLNGRPYSHYELASLRRSIAIVAQDDVLYAGTIAENISLWDPDANLDRLRRATESACIYDDLMRMPMGFDTLVGDMGAALSGGQKSRVLIARALYREPSVLFLDEATAQLDPGIEKALVEQLRGLPMTRILITHRPQPARQADRVIRIERGKALPVIKSDAAKVAIAV